MSARSKKPPKTRALSLRERMIATARSALAPSGEFTPAEMDYIAVALVDDVAPPKLAPLASLQSDAESCVMGTIARRLAAARERSGPLDPSADVRAVVAGLFSRDAQKAKP